jgi:hypothetical protein
LHTRPKLRAALISAQKVLGQTFTLEFLGQIFVHKLQTNINLILFGLENYLSFQCDQIGRIFAQRAIFFPFGHLLKHTIFLDNFIPCLSLCINFDKNGLGYILDDFFTNSSGHPGFMAQKTAKPIF